MTFKIAFTSSKHYYKESYEELISLKKFKKFEPILAIILLFFGVFLFISDSINKLKFLPIVFIILGVYEFFKFYYDKNKWIEARAKSGIINKELVLEFDDFFIKHSGPFSSGEISWSGIKSIKKTKRGIILNQETGTSIYLPDSVFKNSEQVKFILSKTQETAHNRL